MIIGVGNNQLTWVYGARAGVSRASDSEASRTLDTHLAICRVGAGFSCVALLGIFLVE